MAWVHQALKRPGVTLQRLHLEYLEHHAADGYHYSQKNDTPDPSEPGALEAVITMLKCYCRCYSCVVDAEDRSFAGRASSCWLG